MGYLNKGLPPPRVQPNAAGPAEGDSSPVPGSGSFKGGGSFRSTGGSFRKSRLAISFASNGAETSERTTAESSESPVSTRRLGRQSTKKLGGEEGDEPQAPKRRGSITTSRLMATARRGSVAPGRRSSVASLKRCSIASAADDEGSSSRRESIAAEPAGRPAPPGRQMTRRFSTLGGTRNSKRRSSISGSFLGNNIAEFETKLATVFGGILGARKGTVAGEQRKLVKDLAEKERAVKESAAAAERMLAESGWALPGVKAKPAAEPRRSSNRGRRRGSVHVLAANAGAAGRNSAGQSLRNSGRASGAGNKSLYELMRVELEKAQESGQPNPSVQQEGDEDGVESMELEAEDEAAEADEPRAGDEVKEIDYEDIAMKKRRKEIRRDKQLQAVVKRLWNVAETKNFRISRFEYLDYHLSVTRVLLEQEEEEFDESDVWESGMSDWKDDAKGQDLLHYDVFFDSVFELADLYTESVDEKDYIAFLQVLFTEATKPGKPKRSWKHTWPRDLHLDVVEKVVPLLAEYTDKGCEGAPAGSFRKARKAIRRSSLVMLQEAVGLVKESNKRAKQPENGRSSMAALDTGLGLAAGKKRITMGQLTKQAQKAAKSKAERVAANIPALMRLIDPATPDAIHADEGLSLRQWKQGLKKLPDEALGDSRPALASDSVSLAVFRALDIDCDGRLSAADLKAAFCDGPRMEEGRTFARASSMASPEASRVSSISRGASSNGVDSPGKSDRKSTAAKSSRELVSRTSTTSSSRPSPGSPQQSRSSLLDSPKNKSGKKVTIAG